MHQPDPLGEPEPQLDATTSRALRAVRTSLPTLAALVGAAERVLEKRTRSHEVEALALVEEARDRLAQRPFRAFPLKPLRIKAGSGERVVYAPDPVERVIETALLRRLSQRIEALFVDGVHGYRAGRSASTAALAASLHLREGRTCVLQTDITAFFPSVDRERLLAKLARVADDGVLEVVHALISAVHEDGSPSTGLPLGRVLAPLLSNLALVDVDAAVCAVGGCGYVRYGDDILVLAPDGPTRERAEEVLRAALAVEGLALHVDKTRRFVFDGSPFVHLGHTVDARGLFERVSGPRLEKLEQAVARPSGVVDGDTRAATLRRRTLYLTEHGVMVRVADGLVVATKGREVVAEAPLHRVDRVLVLAGVTMTSGFVSACIAQGIPVLFFVGKGRAYGALVSSGSASPLRLRAQYVLSGDGPQRLRLARDVVDAKVQAMERRIARVDGANDAREGLARLRGSLPTRATLDEVRGVEGAATKSYYAAWATRLRVDGFAFTSRSKRPPLDPINSLLSFSYALLLGEMQTALLAHDLDPYCGLLHELHRGHPALASDLVEPYRVLVADSFVLQLVNNRVVHVDGFEFEARGGCFLRHEARRTLLEAWESFFDRALGGGKGTASPRDLIDAAALAMVAVVVGESDRLALPLGGPLDNRTDNEGAR